MTRRSRDRAAGPCRSRGCARHGLLLQQRGRGLRPGGPGAEGTRGPRRGRRREGRSAPLPPPPGLPGRGGAVGARRFPAAGQSLGAAPACRRPRVTRFSLVSRCRVCPPGAAGCWRRGLGGRARLFPRPAAGVSARPETAPAGAAPAFPSWLSVSGTQLRGRGRTGAVTCPAKLNPRVRRELGCDSPSPLVS